MSDDKFTDYYEVLQVSTNAEVDTVHRVYRLLAQRFHPDNQETGNARRFQELTQAYQVLSDPERRAKYDVTHNRMKQDRWRLIASGEGSETDFAFEQAIRLTVLEALYTKRRVEPHQPDIFVGDLEQLIGRPREQLEFTVWYLIQKSYVQRSDNSRLTITVAGAEFLEQNYHARAPYKRLNPASQDKPDVPASVA